MVYLTPATPWQIIDDIYNGATVTSEYQKAYKDYASQKFDLCGLSLAISAVSAIVFGLFAERTAPSAQMVTTWRLVSSSIALIAGAASIYFFKKNQNYYSNLVTPQVQAIEGILLSAKLHLLNKGKNPFRNWDRSKYEKIKSIVNMNKSPCVASKAWSEFRQACETYIDAMKKYKNWMYSPHLPFCVKN